MDSRTLAVVFWPAADAWAWGATGHEWISGIAIEKLPDDVPGFVRTPEAGLTWFHSAGCVHGGASPSWQSIILSA